MYLYESHLGGLYLAEEQFSFDDLYCDVCGDSDLCLGSVETFNDIMDIITDPDGFVPYTDEHLAELKAMMEV